MICKKNNNLKYVDSERDRVDINNLLLVNAPKLSENKIF